MYYPNLFNDFFSVEWPVRRSAATAPAINVQENATGYHVEIAAPGMTKKDFQLHVNDQNELVVTMEKKEETNNEANAGKYLRREFNYSRYAQNLLLPDDVDAAKITAKMEHGVLQIELPKLQPQVTKNPTRVIDIR